MKKNAGLFFFSLLVSIAVFVLLSIPLGPVPPFGPFFNPDTGFWANAEIDETSAENIVINHSALSDSVHVYFDKLGILTSLPKMTPISILRKATWLPATGSGRWSFKPTLRLAGYRK